MSSMSPNCLSMYLGRKNILIKLLTKAYVYSPMIASIIKKTKWHFTSGAR